LKAVRITEPGGPEVLRLVEVEAPRPARGEVQVRVRAAGLNRADLLQRRGLYPAPRGGPQDIPGLEFAGEVAELGESVGGVAVGDPVMGLVPGGGYAELVTVSAAHLLEIPEGLDAVEAGAIPEAFLTAADALFTRGGLVTGESVLLHSVGGGVGSAAVQLARLAGARPIIGTASAPKLEALAALGLAPDVGIDYRSEAFAERTREATGDRGVDVIIDTIGATYWTDNLRTLAPLGRLVVLGLMGGARTEVDLGTILRRRLTVVGTVLRSRSIEEKTDLTASFRERWLSAFTAGDLRAVVDRTFPLAEAAEAHRFMEENRNLGKLLLLP